MALVKKKTLCLDNNPAYPQAFRRLFPNHLTAIAEEKAGGEQEGEEHIVAKWTRLEQYNANMWLTRLQLQGLQELFPGEQNNSSPLSSDPD